MKKEEKSEVMRNWEVSNRLNSAKDDISRAISKLISAGMTKDADDLMKIIFKIESIQNRYW